MTDMYRPPRLPFGKPNVTLKAIHAFAPHWRDLDPLRLRYSSAEVVELKEKPPHICEADHRIHVYLLIISHLPRPLTTHDYRDLATATVQALESYGWTVPLCYMTSSLG